MEYMGKPKENLLSTKKKFCTEFSVFNHEKYLLFTSCQTWSTWHILAYFSPECDLTIKIDKYAYFTNEKSKV